MLHTLKRAAAIDSGVMSPSGTTGLRFWLGHPAYWWCQALGWGGGLWLGVWANWVRFNGDVGEVYDRFLTSTLNTLVGLFFTHIFRWVILANGWKEKELSAIMPRVIAISAITGVTYTWIWIRTDPKSWQESEVQSTTLIGVWMTIFFICWFVIYFAVHYYLQFRDARMRTLKLELSKTEAELASLRAQMNPHFLFNGLNALRDLIDHDPNGARTMVTRLARLFRASLSTEGRRTIPLAEELEAVEAYLHVEKVRFEERLEIRRSVPDDTLDSRVPPFLLQTLVENAVKYGVGASGSPGYVSYDAMKCDDILVLTVRNPGVLSHHSDSTGMGLKITRERLSLLYGTRADLEIIEKNGEVMVQALIPLTTIGS